MNAEIYGKRADIESLGNSDYCVLAEEILDYYEKGTISSIDVINLFDCIMQIDVIREPFSIQIKNITVFAIENNLIEEVCSFLMSVSASYDNNEDHKSFFQNMMENVTRHTIEIREAGHTFTVRV